MTLKFLIILLITTTLYSFEIKNIFKDTKKKIITHYDLEPSGIIYDNNTLYVISDDGRLLIEENINNKLKNSKNYNSEDIIYDIKNQDYEGITIYKDYLYVIEEGRDNIISLKYNINKNQFIYKSIDINRYYNNELVIDKAGNGLESLTFYKSENIAEKEKLYFFTANQSKNNKENDKSALMLVSFYSGENKAIIENYYPLYNLTDVSGLYYKNNKLYMISDKNNCLVVFDIKEGNPDFNNMKTYNLPGKNQEGITFDNNNGMFIAQDSGDILYFKIKE